MSTRSPPSACTEGRMRSSSATRAVRREARSRSESLVHLTILPGKRPHVPFLGGWCVLHGCRPPLRRSTAALADPRTVPGPPFIKDAHSNGFGRSIGASLRRARGTSCETMQPSHFAGNGDHDGEQVLWCRSTVHRGVIAARDNSPSLRITRGSTRATQSRAGSILRVPRGSDPSGLLSSSSGWSLFP